MGKQYYAIKNPKGITITNDCGDLVLTRRWLNLKYALMSLALPLFGYHFISALKDMFSAGEFHPVMLVFVAIFIGGVYGVLCIWLNKTAIRVNSQRVSIKHKPLFWLGNKQVFSPLIKQVFVKEEVHRNSKGQTSIDYSVFAILENKKHVKLVSGIDDSNQALFIEQEIERCLAIKDCWVKEEMS